MKVDTTALEAFSKLIELPASVPSLKLVCSGAVTTLRFLPEAQMMIRSSGTMRMVGMA